MTAFSSFRCGLAKFALSAAAILLLWPASLGAYGKTWSGAELERLIKEAGFSLGPLRVKTVLFLNDAGYDSNVYRTSDQTVQDYSITAGPGITVYLPIKKKVVFSISESPRYVYFLETKSERTWNNFLTGQIHFVLERFHFSAKAGLSVAREIWTSEIDIRPQRKEQSLQASILWQPSRKTSFGFVAGESKFKYEDLSYQNLNLPETLNHRELSLNAAAYYQASNRVRARIELEFGRFSFDSPGNPRNSESRGLYGGVDLAPGKRLTGRVRLGLKNYNPEGPGMSGFLGLVGDSAIGVRLGDAFRLRASYARNVRFSTWVGYAYFVENRFAGGASFYLGRNIRLDYDYSHGINDYPQLESGNENPSETRADILLVHRVGLLFRIRERIGLGFSANWWQRESLLDWLNSRRLFVGANLTYDF